MGRKPKFSPLQAQAAFKRVTEKRRHIPTAREFAKELNVSVATAWLMMIRLQLRKPCGHCRGTGWAPRQAEKQAENKKVANNSPSQDASAAREV